ncbi:MAG: phosphatase PAP2 family protein [Burkholderiaceae bacterium]
MKTPELATKATRSERIAFALLVLSAALIAWLMGDGRIDERISSLYFDAIHGVFPWHENRWIETVLYRDGKLLVIALDIVAIAALLLAMASGRLPTRMALAASVGMIAIPATIGLLKLFSSTHCPWDLANFGGTLPHIALLEWARADPPGHCLPAGHPSAGLSLFGLVLPLFAAGRRGLAAAATISALALGLLMGWLRITQGAHFLSHVLWSFWIAAAISLITARLFAIRLGDLADAWNPPTNPRIARRDLPRDHGLA